MFTQGIWEGAFRTGKPDNCSLIRYGIAVLLRPLLLVIRPCIKRALSCQLVLCALYSSGLSADAPAISQGVASCVAALAQPANNVSALPSSFNMVTWNIEKGNNPRWLEDLQVYQSQPHLILLQEAYSPSPFVSLVGAVVYESFSPGYETRELQTGVMTISSVMPQLHCALTAYEPWLATPKATTVTRYGLGESAESLLVVNTHMVNFEWGVTAFSQQWADIEQILQLHDGPLIVAGDFNTWSLERMAFVAEVKSRHNLHSVSFDPDSRTSFFNLPLDHILTRDLSASQTKVLPDSKSDHNSLWTELHLD